MINKLCRAYVCAISSQRVFIYGTSEKFILTRKKYIYSYVSLYFFLLAKGAAARSQEHREKRNGIYTRSVFTWIIYIATWFTDTRVRASARREDGRQIDFRLANNEWEKEREGQAEQHRSTDRYPGRHCKKQRLLTDCLSTWDGQTATITFFTLLFFRVVDACFTKKFSQLFANWIILLNLRLF